MRYAIWNNKGGVGKTFLSFILACEFALKNPDTKVYVIDLCPQANVSEILLGSNSSGAENLQSLINKRKTIGGYFDSRLSNPHKKTGNESSYVIDIKDYNDNVPENLFLIAGDPSLEIQSQAMNQISAQSLPTDSWKNVHNWVIDIVEALENSSKDPMIFIDCNPSFAMYTELAMVAANRLIVPCTADSSSARALDNIGSLLYGENVTEEYKKINFYTKSIENGFVLPKIYFVVLNRSTQYDKRASKGFGLMFREVKNRVRKLEEKTNVLYSKEDEDTFIDVPDAHTVSIVCSYKGSPLNKLTVGRHEVHDEFVQVNPKPLDRYQAAIDKIVSKL